MQRFINVSGLNPGMGQQEVFQFLKEHKGKWFTSKDIASNLNVSVGSVTNNLKKLRRTEAEVLNYKMDGNRYLYKFK